MEMNVTINQVDGLAMIGRGNSRHWVALDAPEKLGGQSAGTRPMELMLMGIAGCASMDIVAILKKKKVNLIDFKVDVAADREDEHPQVFTRIVFNYTFTGKGIQEKDIDRSIELTDEKYCGAIEMIRSNCQIEHKYTIVEAE